MCWHECMCVRACYSWVCAVGGLIAGSVVAAASGMGVILALSKGGVNAIVGTSISASLLPPCVNSGICGAYIICIYYFTTDLTDMSRYKQTLVVRTFRVLDRFHHSIALHSVSKLLVRVQVSLILYMMNFFLIVVVGVFTLRYACICLPNPNQSTLIYAASCYHSHLHLH
jgi:hypothetical protein